MLMVYKCVYLHSTSKIQSSPSLSLKDVRKMKPIRILLTRKFLVIAVRLEKLPKGLFMRSFSAQDLTNWLRFWTRLYRTHKRHLIVFYDVTRDGPDLSNKQLKRMRGAATSAGWMADTCVYLETQSPRENISRYLDIFRMESL